MNEWRRMRLVPLARSRIVYANRKCEPQRIQPVINCDRRSEASWLCCRLFSSTFAEKEDVEHPGRWEKEGCKNDQTERSRRSSFHLGVDLMERPPDRYVSTSAKSRAYRGAKLKAQ